MGSEVVESWNDLPSCLKSRQDPMTNLERSTFRQITVSDVILMKTFFEFSMFRCGAVFRTGSRGFTIKFVHKVKKGNHGRLRNLPIRVPGAVKLAFSGSANQIPRYVYAGNPVTAGCTAFCGVFQNRKTSRSP